MSEEPEQPAGTLQASDRLPSEPDGRPDVAVSPGPAARPTRGARFRMPGATSVYEVLKIDGHVTRLAVHHTDGTIGFLSVMWPSVLRDIEEQEG